MATVTLKDRAVIRFAGADASRLLQDVLTPDLDKLADDEALPGALLTPQGKVMFDFVIARDGDGGFLADLPASLADDFMRRMMLYRLRAKMEIERAEGLTVVAAWDGDAPQGARRDRRFRGERHVHRAYVGSAPADSATAEDYARLRIEESVAEMGPDYPASEAFPHDVLMDRNGGVSFRKGCFVGQEVVSRMQHRATARRRLVSVTGADVLPDGEVEITAGGRAIGTLGSRVSNTGLAIVRIDKAGAAMTSGAEIAAGGVPVTLTLAPWTGLSFETAAQAGEA